MIMKNYRNFFLWIGAVALLAVTIGFFMPSAPLRPHNPQHQAVNVMTGRGARAVPKTNLPAQSQAPSKPENAAADSPFSQGEIIPRANPRDITSKPELRISYPKLKAMLEKESGNVQTLTFQTDSLKVVVKLKDSKIYSTILPDQEAKLELRKLADSVPVEYEVIAPQDQAPGYLTQFLMLAGVMVIVSVVFMFIQRRFAGAGGGGGLTNGFGKSKAKNVKELGERADKVTFNDVAGCDEAVAELKRVASGLINLGIYADFDGELPRGILLLGPPGTGKTLLAKALANEIDGTMKALSGSDFVEMLVGVGAARVRDEFNIARQTVDKTGKPYIIFIDEFDAIGGKRGNGAAGGNSERENTLNQLLVEMDGVHTNNGILVVAATNRADMLDEAVLRPGRLDCHVSVDNPDIAGREKIFEIHTRKKRLAANVTTLLLAQRTYGYSGAEIKGACNRAAIVAAERWAANAEKLKAEGKSAEDIATLLPKEIQLHDFDEGIDFVRLGGAKAGSQARMPEEEKQNTAIHESGHAIVAATVKGSDPVVKITIMRRSRALGYVQYMPDTDRVSFSDQQAVARIICAMAGRAAQEVYLNRVDTGASNDFEQASDMAYMMVTKWGMSRLGRFSVGQRGAAIGSHGGGGGQLPYGDVLANEIDIEWRRIVDECYKIARYIVETERDRMLGLSQVLMKEETMLTPAWKEFLNAHPAKSDPAKVAFNPAF